MRRLVALAALGSLALPALADEVTLVRGGKLVGRTRREGGDVVVTTPAGDLRLPASDVASIVPGRTVLDDYADRAKALAPQDAAAETALGVWCRDNGLAAHARRHFERAVAIEPDRADARAHLGHVRYEDRWLTLDEYRRARGFVKVDGEWISSDEARRREAARRERAAFAKHEKTIRDSVTRMSSMKRATRLAAKLALQDYAEEIGDLRLAAFASEVAAFYDAGWRRVRDALVAVEVRATHATLKRPIPTITTSLGANSTPVTIQLPELSVVSIRTTALLPAEIELDDDP